MDVSGIIRRIAQKKARRLNVYDFDDTLVSSQSSVSVEHGDGEMTVLDSASFAYFKPTEGDSIDFSDFNHVTRPRIIKKNMDMIRKADSDPETRTVILTARPKGSASSVKKFMDHLGVKNVEVVALQSSDPMDKARWIEKESGDDVEEVNFVDDSSRNVAAVDTLKGKIKASVRTVNPPHPKDGDYEGDALKEVFESEAPTSAKVKVEHDPRSTDSWQKGHPGKNPQWQERQHGTSPWWSRQSPEFKKQYCTQHEESKYCHGMAASILER